MASDSGHIPCRRPGNGLLCARVVQRRREDCVDISPDDCSSVGVLTWRVLRHGWNLSSFGGLSRVLLLAAFQIAIQEEQREAKS